MFRGFTQKEPVDYKNVFSPVVKHKSIRMLLLMVVELNLELEEIDVKIAYLYGDLGETIFMKQQEGFEVGYKKDYVCKLNIFLYGLKQSLRQWNKWFE